jgi:hypothetical protein
MMREQGGSLSVLAARKAGQRARDRGVRLSAMLGQL